MKILVFLIFALVFLVESRKKKKKAKQPKIAQNPLDKRPSKIKPELYCDSCIAMVKESVKELRGKKKESDVIDVVENVCDPERYYSYRMNISYQIIFLSRSSPSRDEGRMRSFHCRMGGRTD